MPLGANPFTHSSQIRFVMDNTASTSRHRSSRTNAHDCTWTRHRVSPSNGPHVSPGTQNLRAVSHLQPGHTKATRACRRGHRYVCSVLVLESPTEESPHIFSAQPRTAQLGLKELTTIADEWPDCTSAAEILRLLVSPLTT